MERELDEIQQLYNKIPQQIITHFHSALQQYALHTTQLQISSQLDEHSLNQLVTDMLQSEALPLFEFLVEGHILRGKLKSHIVRHSLSVERALNIEFTPAFPKLDQHSQTKDDDWVAALTAVEGVDGPSFIAVALQSGKISLYDPSLGSLTSFTGDEDPIKAIKVMPAKQENSYYCISGGLGESLNVHLLTGQKAIDQSRHIASNIHLGSIQAIAVSPGVDEHIVTGGEQGALNIWGVPQDLEEMVKHSSVKQKKKKKELSLGTISLISNQQVHEGSIECLQWLNDHEVISGSSEHRMQVTNISKQQPAETFLTRDSVVTSIDSSSRGIVSAHEDGQIRLWDRRDPARPASTFKAHSKWTSCVKFNQSPFYFASGSYDRTVKIWDLRCGFPIQNIPAPDDKILGLDWVSSHQVVAGGSGGNCHLYSSSA